MDGFGFFAPLSAVIRLTRAMPNKLKIEIPSQGWKQLLASRKEMLDAFDSAREKSKSQKVEVYHGRVAEAELRKWLSRFLPKRYGVTPVYVVSPGLKSSVRTPHFDVIIYDQLESPILWVEDFPDSSSQGQSRAIPVEYVQCVLEVKSDFSPKTSGEAMKHLNELLPLMGGPDKSQERYKLHLPTSFCCGLVFYDLKQNHQFSESALRKLIAGIELRRFFGGVVLRGEGHKIALTGKLEVVRSETPIKSLIGRDKASLLKMGMTKSVKVADTLYYGAMLTWAETNFSRFGFDLLAMMQGTFEVGRLSSFYGIGTSAGEQSRT